MIFKRKSRNKIGIVLGGGGARGLAHIGVLKVLERENIPIDYIVGTSAGAIIGGLYAQTGKLSKVERRIRTYLESREYKQIIKSLEKTRRESTFGPWIDRLAHFIKHQYMLARSLTSLGLLEKKILEEAIALLFDEQDIRELSIPFAAVATDLIKGEEVVFTSGSIRKAIFASSAIPGVFPPLRWNGKYLVDGCVLANLPVHVAYQLGMERVIAVDVSRDFSRPQQFRNGMDIIFRADEITGHALYLLELQKASLVIRPEMGGAHWADFYHMDSFIRMGELAAEKVCRNLHALISPQGFWKTFLNKKFRKEFV